MAAWFLIVVGTAVIGWWAIAAATSGIPELEQGRRDIIFHIAAEIAMAWMLISGGILVLRRGSTPATVMLAGLALGALLYSSINSPGYFVERGEWWAVWMFTGVGLSAAVAAIRLATGQSPQQLGQRSSTQPQVEVRSSTMTRRRTILDSAHRIGSRQ